MKDCTHEPQRNIFTSMHACPDMVLHLCVCVFLCGREGGEKKMDYTFDPLLDAAGGAIKLSSNKNETWLCEHPPPVSKDKGSVQCETTCIRKIS